MYLSLTIGIYIHVGRLKNQADFATGFNRVVLKVAKS